MAKLQNLLFNLERLRITAYSDRARDEQPRGLKAFLGMDENTMEVMFNPETYSRKHSLKYQKPKGINMPGQEARYSLTDPDELSFKIILDGTFVAYSGARMVVQTGIHYKQRSGDDSFVTGQIEKFKKLCLHIIPNTHEPPFLKISWGSLNVKARLKTLDISYTLFDQSGHPIRAELDVIFVEDKSYQEMLRRDRLASPDVTHRRVVREGDTLPALAREIYGSSDYYLQVAQANGLDDFRNLEAGRELFFPPIAK